MCQNQNQIQARMWDHMIPLVSLTMTQPMSTGEEKNQFSTSIPTRSMRNINIRQNIHLMISLILTIVISLSLKVSLKAMDTINKSRIIPGNGTNKRLIHGLKLLCPIGNSRDGHHGNHKTECIRKSYLLLFLRVPNRDGYSETQTYHV